MCKIETNPDSTQVFVYTKLFKLTRVELTSGDGLDLALAEPTLHIAAFTRQKLTRLSLNPGRTRVNLCRVNRAIFVCENRREMMYILVVVLLEKSYFKDRFFFSIIFAKN